MLYTFLDKNGTHAHCDVFVRGNLLVLTELADNPGQPAGENIEAVASQLCRLFDIYPKDLVLAERRRLGSGRPSVYHIVHFIGGSCAGRFYSPRRYPVQEAFLYTIDAESRNGAEAVRQLVLLKELLGDTPGV